MPPWEDITDQEQWEVPDDVCDLMFRMHCPTLRVDHALALSRAVTLVLPWFNNSPMCGLHLIHVNEGGNGWERPGAEEVMNLSGRARLIIRIPRERERDARALENSVLDVGGHGLRTGTAKVRRLVVSPTLKSLHVVSPYPDESVFVDEVLRLLDEIHIHPPKLMCGRPRQLNLEEGPCHTRSVMVAGLTKEESIHLQQRGIGPARNLGCGLFVPHKAIDPVHNPIEH